MLRFITKLLILSVLACTAFARDMSLQGENHYGPNVRHGALLESPLVWGAGIPKARYQARFDWLEPLQAERYGSPLGTDPLFLRLQAGTNLSPLFAQGELGVGIQALPRVEMLFRYSNMLYLWSNVEMAMPGRTEESDISQTWRGSYIFDNLYDGAELDQIQSFQFVFEIDLSGMNHRAGLEIKHSLIDVNTDLDGKSMDYMSGMPVYSRDFLFELAGWAELPLWAGTYMMGEAEYQTTAYIKDIISRYTKDPQQQFRVQIGPEWRFRGRNPWNIAVLPGWWYRYDQGERGRGFDGSLPEQFFVQLQFSQTWNVFLQEAARRNHSVPD